MHYLKRNTKFSILAFLVLILSVTISISTLAKTEVYFSFFYNSISPALQKPEDKIISMNSASQEELTIILQISEPLAQKIIALRDSLSGGFKESQDLLQLPEITNLDWKEWEEQRIIFSVK